jgi:hypothetical protein
VTFQVPHGGARHLLELPNHRVDNAGTAKDVVHPKNLQSPVTPVAPRRLDDHVEIVVVQLEVSSRAFEEGGTNGPSPGHSVLRLFFHAFYKEAQGVYLRLLAQSYRSRLAIAPLGVRVLIGARVAGLLTAAPRSGGIRRRLHHQSHQLTAIRAHPEAFGGESHSQRRHRQTVILAGHD